MGRPLIDLTGQRFGKWTVLAVAPHEPGTPVRWLCRCACGTTAEISRAALRRGGSTQCRSCADKGKRLALAGRRFGKWLVVRRETEDGAGVKNTRWVCRCDCGTVRSVFQQNLMQGTSLQCRSCARRSKGARNG